MRFEFLFLGRTREEFLAAGIDHFLARIRHHQPAEIRIVKERKWSAQEAEERIREEEARLLMARISRPSLVVVLDRAGRQLSSEELAAQLAGWRDQGQRCLSFLIGGPLGLPRQIIREADFALALSRMTLTHEMARLLLLEQVYRACAILAGSGYHK